jgi:hypothetical protein
VTGTEHVIRWSTAGAVVGIAGSLRWRVMSCPVATSLPSGGCRLVLSGGRLEAVVGGGAVGGGVLPPAPDDAGPGADEDRWVVAGAGDGLVVKVGGPGVGPAGERDIVRALAPEALR